MSREQYISRIENKYLTSFKDKVKIFNEYCSAFPLDFKVSSKMRGHGPGVLYLAEVFGVSAIVAEDWWNGSGKISKALENRITNFMINSIKNKYNENGNK